MHFKDSVMSLISQFTGQKNTLTIPKVFITYTGDLNTALFLSQLLYWSDRTNNKEGYVYKTYMEWEEEICLSKYQVSRAVTVLQKKGILETKVKKANGNPTVHYRIKKDEFLQSFVEFIDFGKLSFLTNESGETSQSLTEITTKTTTETTDIKEIAHWLNDIPDRQALESIPPKNKVETKIQYAEFVFMTEAQYNKLLSSHNEETVKRMIEKLDNHKGATGQKYKDDYRAILKWVVDAVTKENKGGSYDWNRKGNQPPADEFDELSF